MSSFGFGLSEIMNISVFYESKIANGTNNEHSSWCRDWRSSQHWMFQLANALFFISFSVPTSYYGILFMHSTLITGFIIFITWAWHVVCAPDILTWNLSFLFINILQLIYLLYQRRPINFNPELEQVYRRMFKPFNVSRIQFKKLVGEQFAQIMTLHIGEAYAMQNLTKTDRLGLLLSGRANVLQDHQLLHPIGPCEFLDSPEFESRGSSEDKFKVSVFAATTCRYIFWQRSALEYLFVKETYLATVFATLVAKDITIKLYLMNNKIVTEKGLHLDIRLPSITPALASKELKAPIIKSLKKQATLTSYLPISPVPAVKITKCDIEDKRQMTKLDKINLANEMGNTGVENWLEKTSKYHSLEMDDED
ncbi:popeye domain-containing protein 3-like isoform X2 [Daktulosphaira vitifoliae]|uniref:popeye domain-containing protein 3-like isoform X2 n=1 Tax=Daktulosphaira vitifoliae TaxID=58002 RepID=UPI0021AAF602|nr:popeye domain-containing protein 3-like isoform X2 [Daktulosphaira vitifoliae]